MHPRTFNAPGMALGLLLATLAPSVQAAAWTSQESGTTATLNAIQFLDAQNGYAVGASGTVLRTTDGGSSWSDVSIDTAYPIQDLSMISGIAGWVVAGDPDASEVSGAVWRTTDAGANWTQETLTSTRARFGVSFPSAATGWACGARNGAIDIQATTDGGSTWTEQSSASVFGWTYGIDAVSPALAWSCGVVFFPAASGFVVHTTDGGTSWSAQPTGTVPFLYGIDFVSPTVGFCAGEQGTILATTDGGSSWTAQTSGTVANLADVSFSGPSDGVACGSGGTILATSDGGATWTLEETPTGVGLNGIFILDSGNAWAVGEDGTILRRGGTTDVPARLAGRGVALLQCSPNPFGFHTTVSYQLPGSGYVSLSVYDPAGHRVALLAEEAQTAGEHLVRWDGANAEGHALPSGIYYLRLRREEGAPATLPLVLTR